MATAPIAPIFSAAAHVECPNGPLCGWFTDPPGAVVQLTAAAQFTAAMARWLTGAGYDCLIERFHATSGLILVLDLRLMTSREPVVRSLMMDKARQDASKFSAVTLIPPLHGNPVYLTALHAAAALVSAFGPRVEVTTDVARALERDRIQLAQQ